MASLVATSRLHAKAAAETAMRRRPEVSRLVVGMGCCRVRVTRKPMAAELTGQSHSEGRRPFCIRQYRCALFLLATNARGTRDGCCCNKNAAATRSRRRARNPRRSVVPALFGGPTEGDADIA